MPPRDWRRAHQKGEERIKNRYQKVGYTEREAADKARKEQDRASKRAIWEHENRKDRR